MLDQRALAIVQFTEIESLQERILVDFSELCAAQSGALWVADERVGMRLRAWKGLLDRTALPELVDPALVQPHIWHAGPSLFVPLITPGGELVALAQLSDPIGGEFSEEVLQTCEQYSAFAATALRTATRFTQLRRQGLRDKDTGAYTLSYFTDYAIKEIYKARRYGRAFSLLTFSIDNLAGIRLRIGHNAVRKVQQIILRVIAQTIRDADVVARATEQEFHVLLPETDYFGGLMFLRRALLAMHDEPDAHAIENRVPLGITGGVASFPRDGSDFDELLRCCRRRTEERRGSLHHQLRLEPLPFWDEVELLLGNSRSPKLPDVPGEPSRRGKVADVLFEELQTEVGREFLREPMARGLLYVGGPAVRSDLSIVRSLDHAPRDFAPRVYVLGRHADLQEHSALTPVFLEGDERLARHQFILWLGDGSAYALLARKGRGATWGFHTSDPTLVEGLVSKLQSTYDLQPY